MEAFSFLPVFVWFVSFSWIAQWKQQGCTTYRRFSVSKYGFHEAHQLAIQFKQENYKPLAPSHSHHQARASSSPPSSSSDAGVQPQSATTGKSTATAPTSLSPSSSFSSRCSASPYSRDGKHQPHQPCPSSTRNAKSSARNSVNSLTRVSDSSSLRQAETAAGVGTSFLGASSVMTARGGRDSGGSAGGSGGGGLATCSVSEAGGGSGCKGSRKTRGGGVGRTGSLMRKGVRPSSQQEGESGQSTGELVGGGHHQREEGEGAVSFLPSTNTVGSEEGGVKYPENVAFSSLLGIDHPHDRALGSEGGEGREESLTSNLLLGLGANSEEPGSSLADLFTSPAQAAALLPFFSSAQTASSLFSTLSHIGQWTLTANGKNLADLHQAILGGIEVGGRLGSGGCSFMENTLNGADDKIGSLSYEATRKKHEGGQHTSTGSATSLSVSPRGTGGGVQDDLPHSGQLLRNNTTSTTTTTPTTTTVGGGGGGGGSGGGGGGTGGGAEGGGEEKALEVEEGEGSQSPLSSSTGCTTEAPSGATSPVTAGEGGGEESRQKSPFPGHNAGVGVQPREGGGEEESRGAEVPVISDQGEDEEERAKSEDDVDLLSSPSFMEDVQEEGEGEDTTTSLGVRERTVTTGKGGLATSTRATAEASAVVDSPAAPSAGRLREEDCGCALPGTAALARRGVGGGGGWL